MEDFIEPADILPLSLLAALLLMHDRALTEEPEGRNKSFCSGLETMFIIIINSKDLMSSFNFLGATLNI